MLRARIGVGLAMMSALAAAAVPGPAQRVPDWRQSHLLENEPPVSTLYRVATCLAIRHSEEARALLASAPGSAEEAAAFAALVPDEEDGCLAPTRWLTRYPRSLLREVHLMRGALAEASVRIAADARERLPAASDSAPPQEAPSDPSALARRVASCAAERRPAAVYALLQHNPGSPGEHRELRHLAGEFERCLPDGGALGVDRLSIRALLAEALYRLLQRQASAEAPTS